MVAFVEPELKTLIIISPNRLKQRIYVKCFTTDIRLEPMRDQCECA